MTADASPDVDPVACRNLWADVLRRALADAVTTGHFTAGLSMSPDAKAKHQGWVGGKDFRAVCALAGFEPEPVLACYRRAMSGGDEARQTLIVKLYGARDEARRGRASHRFGRTA